MTKTLNEFDTLECPNCGKPTKPKRYNEKEMSVRYSHVCENGYTFAFTINKDGDLIREKLTA